MARRGGIRYAVFTWVPEGLLAEWNDWHNRVHIPNVLSAPQMRGVRKFRIADAQFPGDWKPQYVTVYQLDSLEDYEAYRRGPGILRRRDYDDRYGDVGKVARVMLGEEIQLEDSDAPL
jgi:hypothetical protein